MSTFNVKNFDDAFNRTNKPLIMISNYIFNSCPFTTEVSVTSSFQPKKYQYQNLSISLFLLNQS